MDRQTVSSSSVKSVGYDPATRVLEVELHTGAVYQYLNVPYVVYRDLVGASSIGQYFAHFVKTTYRVRRV